MAFERIRRDGGGDGEALRRASTSLPNLLTMGRIVLIPAILYFIDNYSPVRSFVAMLIYVVASLTDFLDGWIARRRRQVSLLGQYLDPLADKLLVTSVLVYLVAMDRVPAWLVVALLARELAVTGLRTIASSEGLVISASDTGKQKTALQLVGTLFLLIHFKYPVWGLEQVAIKDELLRIDFHLVGMVTLYLALVVSVLSAVDYLRGFFEAMSGRRGQAEGAAEAEGEDGEPRP